MLFRSLGSTNSLFFPVGDSESLAEKMQSMTNLKFRKVEGLRNSKRVKTYSSEIMSQRILSVYSRLL